MTSSIRPAAVAGHFYPDDPVELRALIDELRPDPATPPRPGVRGVLAPHAGYIYSGRTACLTYATAAIPEVCLVLGPNHTGRGRPFALQARGGWRTPLGVVPIDEPLAEALLAGSTLLEADDRAHAREHAIEVQLPILQVLRPDVRIVPICVGSLDPAPLATLADELAAVLATLDPHPLVVISSDMSHYEPADVARRRDRQAIGCLEEVDGPRLYQVVRGAGITMCGIAPATAALPCLRRLGATRGQLVDYSCSGDRTGDYGSVVGYAGLAFV